MFTPCACLLLTVAMAMSCSTATLTFTKVHVMRNSHIDGPALQCNGWANTFVTLSNQMKYACLEGYSMLP